MKTDGRVPPTNVVNLIFVLASQANVSDLAIQLEAKSRPQDPYIQTLDDLAESL